MVAKYSCDGATDYDLILMRKHTDADVTVKAAGGARTLDDLLSKGGNLRCNTLWCYGYHCYFGRCKEKVSVKWKPISLSASCKPNRLLKPFRFAKQTISMQRGIIIESATQALLFPTQESGNLIFSSSKAECEGGLKKLSCRKLESLPTTGGSFRRLSEGEEEKEGIEKN